MNSRPAAAVIPIRSPEALETAALERAVRAPAGRGRAVLLAVAPQSDPSALLRGAAGQPSGRVRYVVVAADPSGAEVLAARILSDSCEVDPPAPRALLRAWLAHLASQGRELAVGLDEPGRLSLDAAGWLGRLVRDSRGAMRIVIPWASDSRIWRVIEALGLETEVVPAYERPRDDRASTPARGADPRPPSAAPHPAGSAAATVRPRGRTRALLAAGVLACLVSIPATLWWTTPRDASAPPDPIAAPAATLPVASSSGSLGRYGYDPRTGLVSLDVREEPVGRLLADLARDLGFELRDLATAPMDERVTLKLEAVPIEQALRALLRGHPRTFVYANDTPVTEPPRLSVLILHSQARPLGEAEPPGVVEEHPGVAGVAQEVEHAIATLLVPDVDDRHAAAIERLLALDPPTVARELVYQLDHLAPVGPLASTQVEAVRKELRTALCGRQTSPEAGGTLPPELDCRPAPPAP